KKAAIRDILRDRIHDSKALQLPGLLAKLKMIRQQEGGMDPASIERIVSKLQGKFKNYDRYEIRHIVKSELIVDQFFGNKLTYPKQPLNLSQREKISIFDSIHNAAKRDLYESKYKFDHLNKHLSRAFGLSEFEINKKIYAEYCTRADITPLN